LIKPAHHECVKVVTLQVGGEARESPAMLDRQAVFKIVASTDLFASVAPAQIDHLIQHAVQRRFEPTTYIFNQGDAPDAAYIVLSGEIGIVSVSFEGHSLFHLHVDPGGIFGEVGALDEGPRTSGALAIRTSDLLVIPVAEFTGLLERNGTVALLVAKTMARRIRATSQLLEDAVFLPALNRVARKLCALAVAQGHQRPRGIVLENVSHEILGSMVGLHRVTVTNQIATLEREGLVQSERKRLVLLDLAKLQTLASNPVTKGR
jgi:CRP/FNR family transcriptional regulator, cyclic AMP receptor protein